MITGRFAPSPTGPLHLGSLVAAVGSYLFAKRAGGRWLVRIEDIDTPRVVPGSAEEILATLRRYGLQWDGDVVWQSQRTALYEAALDTLRERGLVYDCACSRAELQRRGYGTLEARTAGCALPDPSAWSCPSRRSPPSTRPLGSSG